MYDLAVQRINGGCASDEDANIIYSNLFPKIEKIPNLEDMDFIEMLTYTANRFLETKKELDRQGIKLEPHELLVLAHYNTQLDFTDLMKRNKFWEEQGGSIEARLSKDPTDERFNWDMRKYLGLLNQKLTFIKVLEERMFGKSIISDKFINAYIIYVENLA